MIMTKDLENSVVFLISNEYPNADIFRRDGTQTKENTPTFVVNVEVNATTELRDYQRKDVEIVVQYFINNKIEFNKDLTNVRDILLSKLFINSIPIYDKDKNVLKYLIIKEASATVLDDILAVRVVTDYVDDVIVTNKTFDLIGNLHLNKEC